MMEVRAARRSIDSLALAFHPILSKAGRSS